MDLAPGRQLMIALQISALYNSSLVVVESVNYHITLYIVYAYASLML